MRSIKKQTPQDSPPESLATNAPIELAHFSLKGVAWISPQLRTSNAHYYKGPSKLARFSLLAGGPIGLQLRASNEGLLRPRVARAQETNGLPDSFNPPFLPRPNL